MSLTGPGHCTTVLLRPARRQAYPRAVCRTGKQTWAPRALQLIPTDDLRPHLHSTWEMEYFLPLSIFLKNYFNQNHQGFIYFNHFCPHLKLTHKSLDLLH